jgi:FkbM family methyltransferase
VIEAIYRSLPRPARRAARATVTGLPLVKEARRLRGHVRLLEKKVAKLERALQARDRRIEELDSGFTGGPLLSLDYSGADIKIVRLARRRWKAQGKEPFTVDWIERYLKPGDAFYDIGANIGAYSLIAAKATPASVPIVAIEPSFTNFALLCANIAVNEVGDRILPLPISLGEETRVGVFRYRTLEPGAARHDSPAIPAPTFDTSAYDQPMLTYRLDDVVAQFGLPPPTHIKLDVDGAEAAVLAGSPAMLAESTRTLMVEVAPDDLELTRILRDLGFSLSERYDRAREGRCWYGLFERA